MANRKRSKPATEADRIKDQEAALKHPRMQSKESQAFAKKNIAEAKSRQKYNKLKKKAQEDTKTFGHYDDSTKPKKKKVSITKKPAKTMTSEDLYKIQKKRAQRDTANPDRKFYDGRDYEEGARREAEDDARNVRERRNKRRTKRKIVGALGKKLK